MHFSCKRRSRGHRSIDRSLEEPTNWAFSVKDRYFTLKRFIKGVVISILLTNSQFIYSSAGEEFGWHLHWTEPVYGLPLRGLVQHTARPTLFLVAWGSFTRMLALHTDCPRLNHTTQNNTATVDLDWLAIWLLQHGCWTLDILWFLSYLGELTKKTRPTTTLQLFRPRDIMRRAGRLAGRTMRRGKSCVSCSYIIIRSEEWER